MKTIRDVKEKKVLVQGQERRPSSAAEKGEKQDESIKFHLKVKNFFEPFNH